jgi:dienelactone hydrolase
MWRLKTACSSRALAHGLITLFLMQAAAQAAPTPKITITPTNVVIGSNVKIILHGFEKNQLVTISASSTNSIGQVWESHADFLTDRHGRVDLATQTPISGTYRHSDPMGLFWSMSRFPGEKMTNKPTSGASTEVDIHVTATVNDKILAAAILRRIWLAPGVEQIPVHDNGLRGTLFLPSGKTPHPGVIVLGGSEGGMPEIDAAYLASKGYAALALAYFRYDDLPKSLENISLEYFETAIGWLEARKEIRHDGIAVLGHSRGAELALLLGSTFPHIRAVIAFAPSNVIWPGLSSTPDGNEPPAWIYKGQPLPFMNLSQLTPEQKKEIDHLSPTNPGTPTLWCQIQLENTAAVNNASIQVEKINGPILLISGNDDKLWPSTEMANRIISRLKETNHRFPDNHLAYLKTGHYIPLPNMPATVLLALGGDPENTAAAAVDSWAHVIKFLNSAFRQ